MTLKEYAHADTTSLLLNKSKGYVNTDFFYKTGTSISVAPGSIYVRFNASADACEYSTSVGATQDAATWKQLGSTLNLASGSKYRFSLVAQDDAMAMTPLDDVTSTSTSTSTSPLADHGSESLCYKQSLASTAEANQAANIGGATCLELNAAIGSNETMACCPGLEAHTWNAEVVVESGTNCPSYNTSCGNDAAATAPEMSKCGTPCQSDFGGFGARSCHEYSDGSGWTGWCAASKQMYRSCVPQGCPFLRRDYTLDTAALEDKPWALTCSTKQTSAITAAVVADDTNALDLAPGKI